ncbi:deoxyribonuclease Tat-D [Dichotomopilus funicola]|uniref:Deoxyribonuclease Tat-D n=1 Tax=Dichotomopilus funicola TaxID=1934379 RepID=A0AAN6V136_9PEZI|nr:deoxyribonuclease Tat-D [Dichotomopilus funicola]
MPEYNPSDLPNGHSATPAVSSPTAYQPRYIDIGINLADPIFRGRYRGKVAHPDDLEGVVARAVEVGCTKLIVTGSSMKSSRNALQLAKQFPGTVFTTAGIHPCSSSIFGLSHQKHHEESEEVEEPEDHTPACGPDPTQPIQDGHGINHTRSEQIIKDLADLIAQARTHTVTASPELVAFGEFGLDYDRLHFCSKEAQLHSFAAQLQLAASISPQLPLFLHSRAAHTDFVRLLKDAFGPRLERLEKGGVVHSFTGTAEEMRELMDLGLYIGINGCSFKTAENCDVVREVDLSRLMIETDGPWCEVRPAHEGWKYLVEWEAKAKAAAEAEAEAQQQQQQQQAKKNQKKEPEVPDRFKVVKKEKWVEGAMVKGRNEPCTIERIARIIAGIKGVSVEEVCEAAWANTVNVFDVDG